jgi:hypothetical protein
MWGDPQHHQRPERQATCCVVVARHISWCCLADTNANVKHSTPFKHICHCTVLETAKAPLAATAVWRLQVQACFRPKNHQQPCQPNIGAVFCHAVEVSVCRDTPWRAHSSAELPTKWAKLGKCGARGNPGACASTTFSRTHSNTRHATATAAAQANSQKLPRHPTLHSSHVNSKAFGFVPDKSDSFAADNHAVCQPTPCLGCAHKGMQAVLTASAMVRSAQRRAQKLRHAHAL